MVSEPSQGQEKSRFKDTNSRSSPIGWERVLSLKFFTGISGKEESLWTFPMEGVVQARDS